MTARVRVPAGRSAAGEQRTATPPCPTGMKVANFVLPEQRFPQGALDSIGLADGTIPGYSTRGQLRFTPGAVPRAVDITMGIVCRRPDANGSVIEHPRKPQPGERLAHGCAKAFKYIYDTPGVLVQGRVWRGAPVAIQRRSRSGRWTHRLRRRRQRMDRYHSALPLNSSRRDDLQHRSGRVA